LPGDELKPHGLRCQHPRSRKLDQLRRALPLPAISVASRLNARFISGSLANMTAPYQPGAPSSWALSRRWNQAAFLRGAAQYANSRAAAKTGTARIRYSALSKNASRGSAGGFFGGAQRARTRVPAAVRRGHPEV
jgi:hypothetical protein